MVYTWMESCCNNLLGNSIFKKNCCKHEFYKEENRVIDNGRETTAVTLICTKCGKHITFDKFSIND